MTEQRCRETSSVQALGSSKDGVGVAMLSLSCSF